MKWTEIAETIGMQEEVYEALKKTAETFDRAAYAEDIAALADPNRVAAAFETLSKKLDPDEGNLKMELCQLMAAEIQWDKYKKLGIPETVFWDTLGALSRFLRETKVYRGVWAVDREWWSWRQISMTIFRLGVLEFELSRHDGKIHIHIPSESDFSPASVDASLKQIRPFCRKYFPEFADADITCHSWLLSAALPELLPETSNILSFQRRFELLSYDPDAQDYVQFLFQMLPGTPTEELREISSLQRKAKARLLAGGKIGVGFGVLKEIPY